MLTPSRKELVHLILTVRPGFHIPAGELRSQLSEVAAEGIRACNATALAVASADDHLHALVAFHGECGPDNLADRVKRGTADWLRTRLKNRAGFEWNAGFAAFAVERSLKLDVRDFILDQARYHRRFDFQYELAKLRECPLRLNLPANWN